jgi:hypothetical protein
MLVFVSLVQLLDGTHLLTDTFANDTVSHLMLLQGAVFQEL